MKWTITLLVLLGVIAAFCASMLAASLRTGNNGSVVSDEQGEAMIIVATRPISALTVIDAGAITTRKVAADSVSASAKLTAADVIGQVLIAPIVEGETITAEHFASRDSGLHLATTLPEGRRAMSVYLTTDSGIESLLYPGCVVDVISSFRLPASHGRPSGEVVSATLLQGVQVLAIGPRSIVTRDEDVAAPTKSADRKRERMVTLMVDSDQAEALQLASAHGELTLTLRNPTDMNSSPNRGVFLSDLSDDIADRLGAIAAPAAMLARDSEEGPVAAPAPVPTKTHNVEQHYWTTIVHRGRQPERLMFPVEQGECNRRRPTTTDRVGSSARDELRTALGEESRAVINIREEQNRPMQSEESRCGRTDRASRAVVLCAGTSLLCFGLGLSTAAAAPSERPPTVKDAAATDASNTDAAAATTEPRTAKEEALLKDAFNALTRAVFPDAITGRDIHVPTVVLELPSDNSANERPDWTGMEGPTPAPGTRTFTPDVLADPVAGRAPLTGPRDLPQPVTVAGPRPWDPPMLQAASAHETHVPPVAPEAYPAVALNEEAYVDTSAPVDRAEAVCAALAALGLSPTPDTNTAAAAQTMPRAAHKPFTHEAIASFLSRSGRDVAGDVPADLEPAAIAYAANDPAVLAQPGNPFTHAVVANMLSSSGRNPDAELTMSIGDAPAFDAAPQPAPAPAPAPVVAPKAPVQHVTETTVEVVEAAPAPVAVAHDGDAWPMMEVDAIDVPAAPAPVIAPEVTSPAPAVEMVAHVTHPAATEPIVRLATRTPTTTPREPRPSLPSIAVPLTASQPDIGRPSVAMESVETIAVHVGQSVVLNAPWAVSRVSITQTDIADVEVLTPQQVLVIGNELGTTDMILWSDAGYVWHARVNVMIDLTHVRDELDKIFPDCELDVLQSQDVLVVGGTLRRVEQVGQLQNTLNSYGIKYVDKTSVAGVQQVMINVRVAEVSRQAVRALGLNAVYGGNDFFGGTQIGPGGTALNPASIGVPDGSSALGNLPFSFIGDLGVSAGITLFGGLPGTDLELFIQALAENQYLRVLAQPTLVALSGEEASFLAGGEFPVPVVQGSTVGAGSTITIEYKEFGIRLNFLPHVLGESRIRLYVVPEVSDLSDRGAVQIDGFQIPSIMTRRAETTLEMNSGQTFAMAGLLNQTSEVRNLCVPILGDLPIIGSLFRSVRYKNGETELVVMVTATLVEPGSSSNGFPVPGDLHVRPNDWDLYIDGRIEGKATKPAPADAAWLRDMGLDQLQGPGAWADYEQKSAASEVKSSARGARNARGAHGG